MRRFLTLAATALLLATTLAAPVTAASPHQVDPAGMTPPLNPDLDPWICTVTGAGPICRGAFHDTWSDAETDLTCDGVGIRTSGRYDTDAARWHLPDGRATRTLFTSQATETWTLPGGAGPAVTIHAAWNEHYVYPVPGDRSTRVKTITGAYWQVTAKGHGVVFHDAGFARLLPGSEDELAFTKGPSDSDWFDLGLVLDDVCAVLAG